LNERNKNRNYSLLLAICNDNNKMVQSLMDYDNEKKKSWFRIE